MELKLALTDLFISILVCIPLFKYMYKVIVTNGPDFDNGYKQVKKRDAKNDLTFGHGSKDQTVNTFAAYNLVVFLLPLIPSLLLAIPIYFALLGLSGVR